MKIQQRHEQERLELFEELALYKDTPVIVEGRRDAEALNALGFARVLVINRGKSLYDFSLDAKTISGARTVLVLTDFDPEGERIDKELEEYLRSVGCRTDKSARARLRILFHKNKLTTVQGLRNIILA
ncbi:MAG: hypothetical protein HY366_03430 [Candidatus Aenigmarchaeota archaeon]|nr:hypothetical protein [Candidatus Aenigmarchaeota archaeon]